MRKLVIFISAFSVSILISVYLLSPLAVVVCAGIFAVLSVGFIFLSGKNRSRYFISCIGMALGFIYFFVHSSVFTFPAQDYFDTSSEITATLLSYPNEYTAVVSLNCESTLNIRTSLYCPAGFPQYAVPGDTVSAFVEFSSPDNDYLYTSGIKLYATAKSVEITEGSRNLRYLGAYIAHSVKSVIEQTFPDDTGAFAKALITGDKSDFDSLLKTSFRNAGLSHIVAVSGMHLSFALAIPRLFIKKRRKLSVISIPCILFFMAFAGFTPSVCRAGIMHLCVSAANLSRRESDEYTSLFISLFIILLFDPYSIASVSLQLSFASVLGIMIFSSRIYRAISEPVKNLPKLPNHLLLTIISIFSASIGALIFTAPLSALYFGQVSVVAPVTSVLVLGILSFTFLMCVIACTFGLFLPSVGTFMAALASLPLRYIMWIADLVSGSALSSVYTANMYSVIWLILTYAVFITLFILKKPAKSYLIPVFMSVIALLILLLLPSTGYGNSSLEVAVLDVGQGQCIVASTGTMTAIIDCGSVSGENSSQIAADYLHSKGKTTIDYLIITHYHSDHVNGVVDLISEFKVQTLIIPPLEDYTDYDDEIISIAHATGGNVIYINNDIIATMGKTQLTVYPSVADTGENERSAAILCTNGDYDVLITGDMPAYCEKLLLSYASLPDIEVLVAGHHGSSGSSCEELLEAVCPETAVISVGNNHYGHPAKETLERFEKYDIMVLRTDEVHHVILN